MSTRQRPTRRDWAAAIIAGAALGLVFLGIGARVGMRVIALKSGQSGSFTIEGSLAVVLLGGCAGAAVGAIFIIARVLFPTRRWTRDIFFWGVTVAIMLRGLNPVSLLNATVFLPLLGIHGALLHVYWRRERGTAAPAGSPAG